MTSVLGFMMFERPENSEIMECLTKFGQWEEMGRNGS